MSLMYFRIADNEIDILSDGSVTNGINKIMMRDDESKVVVLDKCVVSGTGVLLAIKEVFGYSVDNKHKDMDNLKNDIISYMEHSNYKEHTYTIYLSGYSKNLDRFVVYKIHCENSDITDDIFYNSIILKPDIFETEEDMEENNVIIQSICRDNPLLTECCMLLASEVQRRDNLRGIDKVGIGGNIELTIITKDNIDKQVIGYL